MREILFKGKSVNDGRWLLGGLNDYGDYKSITVTRGFSIIDSCEVIPETISEYTGLSDKNGVKIFENDIVRYGKKNWVVNWNDETFRWEISLKDGCYQYHIYDGQGYPKYVDRITLGWVAAEFQLSGQLSVEVIGNKFDNPELIERDNNEKDWIF